LYFFYIQHVEKSLRHFHYTELIPKSADPTISDQILNKYPQKKYLEKSKNVEHLERYTEPSFSSSAHWK
jgi:hypothetical protein